MADAKDAKSDDQDLVKKLRHELALLRRDAGDDEAKATAFVDKVEDDAKDAVSALTEEARKLRVELATKNASGPKLEKRAPVAAPTERGVDNERGNRLPLLTPEEAAARRNLR